MPNFINQLSDGDLIMLLVFGILVGFSLGGMAAVLVADAFRTWRCKHDRVTVNMTGDVVCLHCRKNLGACPVPGVRPPEHMNCRCVVQPITEEPPRAR